MKIHQLLFYISASLFSISCATSVPEQEPVETSSRKVGQLTRIEMDDLFVMKSNGGVLLVDCRSTLFYHMGHIDGAKSFPYKKLESRFPIMKPELDTATRAGKVIVLYCQNTKCPDAYKAAKELSYRGYNISIYHGGWDEWRSAGLSSL